MLEQQLRQLTADAPEVDPSASLGDVVRRGRIRLVASRVVGGLATAAVVTAAVVTVPLMLEGPMPSPEVLDADPAEDVVHPGEAGEEDGGPTGDVGSSSTVDDAEPGASTFAFDVEVAILHPETGHETDAAEIVVEGVVERGADVWVSGVPATVDGDVFRAVVPLEPGKQELRAFARIGDHRAGVHEVLVVRRVTVAAPSKPAPEDGSAGEEKPLPDADGKPEPVDAAFTAVQVRDHAEGEPPVGLYEGTGPAGHWVKIWSDYGWAKQQIAASGEWRIEVAFREAPSGTHTWPVVAWLLDTEHEHRFEFTGTRQGSSPSTEFTAVQARDHVEGDPPWAVYEGTGPAGYWVKAHSDHGSAKTQIGPSGEWRLEVEFHGAPSGTHTWPVVVWLLETEHERHFEFTGTRPGSEPTTFTAHQVRGESDADPPTDAFWGTAEPGTKVIVESKYGGGRTVVLDDGQWELEVVFHDAPVGEPFPVEVHSLHTGESIWFDFERIG